MRTAIVLILAVIATALLSVVTCSYVRADEACYWNPPPEHDGTYKGKYKVIAMEQDGLNLICRRVALKFREAPQMAYYGCTDIYLKVPTIWILKGGAGCYSENDILRHEIGHLTGWRHR